MKKFIFIFFITGILFAQTNQSTIKRTGWINDTVRTVIGDSLTALRPEFIPVDSLTQIRTELNGLETNKMDITNPTGTGYMLMSGTTGDTPTSGAGTRMMWIPSKKALRAGTAIGTEWDAANIANYSFGFGENVKALGAYSAVFGFYSSSGANSNYSLTQGYYNRNEAEMSLMVGRLDTTLSGAENNHVIGSFNKIGAYVAGKSGYGNWLFGQYLYSNTKGLWAFGADNSSTKKVIPYHDQIVFWNEPLTVALSDDFSASSLPSRSATSWQAFNTSDTTEFQWGIQKPTGQTYSNFGLWAHNDFTDDGSGGLTSAVHRRFINIDNSAGRYDVRLNDYKTDSYDWGNWYLDNGNFIVDGYMDSPTIDSLLNIYTMDLDDIIAGATNVHLTTTLKSNYDAAYTDRLKWDGGATGLTPATARTSLGGTTVGQSIFTLTDPSAISFLRLNANNTVTARSAADFKTDLSLNALTNKGQVELEDSTYTGGATGSYISGADFMTEKDSVANRFKWGNPYGGYLFDGVNDYVSIADNDNLDFGTGDFSVTSYFQTGTDITSNQIVVEKREATPIKYTIYVSNSLIYVELQNGATSNLISTSAIASTTYHIALVRQSGVLYMYKNGVLISSTSSTLDINNTGALRFGARVGESLYFKGILHQSKLFNRALSSSEVKKLYNNGRPDLANLDYADLGANNTDLVSGWDFTSGWTAASATINDTNTFTTAAAGGVHKSYSLGNYVGKRFRLEYALTTSASSVTIRLSTGSPFQTIVSGSTSGTVEFIVSGGLINYNLYLQNASAGTTDFITLKLTQIGCVAEYKGENATASTWFETQNNLHGTTSGSPITLTGTEYVVNDLAVGTFDLDGTPAVGRLTVKAAASDGSSNGLVLRNSTEVNTFRVNDKGSLFLSGGFYPHMTDATNGYVILVTDDLIFWSDASADGDMFMNAGTEGQVFKIIKTDNTVYTATLYPDGSETINGAASYTLTNQYDYVELAFHSGHYYIVGSN